VVLYALDGIASGYSFMVLVIWANKDDFIAIVREIRTIFSSKKNKLKVFEKLKMATFFYETILQNFLYIHAIYLSINYYFLPELSTLMTVTYYIIYFSPLFFYWSAMMNSINFNNSLSDSYSPSLFNVLMLIVAVVYAVLAWMGMLSSEHQTWSMVVLLNVGLFVVTLEGERFGVRYVKQYLSFVRTLIISYKFLLIYLPFVAIFSSGYFLSSFSYTYLYYYSICGFIYIWLIITIVGVSIHWILNLTEKSKKELFISAYM
jgi:hypothetical protein